MQELPFITICMCTYNSNWCLKGVLRSIYNIDYPRKLLRLVFVDGCSTDGTWETLKEFKEKHWREYESLILLRDPQRGLGHAYNVCLKHAKGYIFFAESDRILPPEILTHLFRHFSRDPRVGWAHSAWIREKPTFYERIMLSRFIPKSHRYVDEIEAACSLVRPEAMEAFGLFYEDGGVPFDSHEAAEQFVRLRKAGWKIVNDGGLSNKCIHLSKGEGWGKLLAGESIINLIGRLVKFVWYYLTQPPKRPVLEMIGAGDIKLAFKISYWFALPHIILFAVINNLWWLLLYLSPPIVVYVYEANGLEMKLVTPFFQIVRWMLVAYGTVFLLIKLCIKRMLKR